MSRDLKPRKAPADRKSSGGTLLGLFIGLVIGMVAVAAVVWYINKVPLPFTTTGQQPKLPPPLPANIAPATTPEAAGAAAPVALPGKPGDPIGAEKPLFDFYKILPGKAEAIPDPKPEDVKPSDSKPSTSKPAEAKVTESKPAETKVPEAKPSVAKSVDAKPTESKPTETAKSKEKPDRDTTLKEAIYLQAGSFQNAGEADNQKARLALLGAEARIQQVMLQDKVWYRVRLGPFHKMDEVNHMRGDLARQGIDANVGKKD